MTGALIILLFTAAVGVVLYLTDRRRKDRDTPSTPPEEESSKCCGMHMVCEKESLSPFSTEAEYYDDEELDRFAGRAAESYTPHEVEEFRDILMTMRAEETAGWSRALQVRGVALPTEIRDEVLLIVSELRDEKRKKD